jgi:hypothetical protein
MRPLALAALVVLGFAVSAASATPARADDDLIGLLDVRVEGVSDTAAEVFTKQIEESLGIAGLKVAPRARLREFLAGTSWNAACLVGDCLKELETHAGVAQVIEAALVSIGPSYHYTITLLDTATGTIIRQTSRKCDVCTTDEAFADAALEVVALVTNPDGDGGKPVVDLPRPPPPASTVKGRRATRGAAIALLGAAVVAGAGGAFLLSRDEDRLGAALAGGAGAFAVAGVTCLGVSFSF